MKSEMNYANRSQLTSQINKAIQEYCETYQPLLGVEDAASRDSFSRQVVDSIARVEYVYAIASKPVSQKITQPEDFFDPLKAAIYYRQVGEFDESCWLVFLAINFGKNKKTNWMLVKEVYGAFSNIATHTWETLSKEPEAITNWLVQNNADLQGHFGNHRKYESLNPSKEKHTGKTIESYVNWVNERGGHQSALLAARENSENAQDAFSALYKEMSPVKRFGRTAIFDFLTMLAKIGAVDLEPDKAYIANSTGPKRGMNLLVNGISSSPMSGHEAEKYIKSLGDYLPISRMVMQVMEDAVCNWQKSPSRYIRFSG